MSTLLVSVRRTSSSCESRCRGLNTRVGPEKQAYIDQLLQRLSGSPGIQNAGIDCGNLNASVKVDGQDPRSAAIRAVSPGYLRAMGVPLLRGRWPAEDEMFGVVVNESFAGSADPIGKRIGKGPNPTTRRSLES